MSFQKFPKPKKTCTIGLREGDISKLKLKIAKGFEGIWLQVFDGTHGDGNDLLIQGLLDTRAISEIFEAIRQADTYGYFSPEEIKAAGEEAEADEAAASTP